jgi:hypothetical protein
MLQAEFNHIYSGFKHMKHVKSMQRFLSIWNGDCIELDGVVNRLLLPSLKSDETLLPSIQQMARNLTDQKVYVSLSYHGCIYTYVSGYLIPSDIQLLHGIILLTHPTTRSKP